LSLSPGGIGLQDRENSAYYALNEPFFSIKANQNVAEGFLNTGDAIS